MLHWNRNGLGKARTAAMKLILPVNITIRRLDGQLIYTVDIHSLTSVVTLINCVDGPRPMAVTRIGWYLPEKSTIAVQSRPIDLSRENTLSKCDTVFKGAD